MKSSKLNERSRWLLIYLAHRSTIDTPDGPRQLGMTLTSGTPRRAPSGIDMTTMRGLIRRGYVEERNCIFYSTEAGRARAEQESLLHGGALAFQMGADCQVNGGHFEEYRPQLAERYGYESWRDMPLKIQSDALRQFAAGKKAERTS